MLIILWARLWWDRRCVSRVGARVRVRSGRGRKWAPHLVVARDGDRVQVAPVGDRLPPPLTRWHQQARTLIRCTDGQRHPWVPVAHVTRSTKPTLGKKEMS